ncbi:MAG: L,D-transpeptidase [Xanthobacteraceae bacterium]|nr:L,D-transpeptidase [Xanthobacteraceae bacterium]
MARLSIHAAAATAVTALGTLLAGTASAEPLGFAPWFAAPRPQVSQQVFRQVMPERDTYQPMDETRAMPAQLRRQIVSYPTREAPGTIVIDTPATRLYYVLGGGKAIAYGIGVGRDGFTWSGVQTISRKSEWPDWIPPQEMLQRQPYLPRFMAGGPANPLGARAMYLGGTIYRIHGTNAPETIGTHVSSGCIRLLNEDVIDLYNRVSIGAKVVVLPDRPRHDVKPAAVAHIEPRARETFASAGSIRPFSLY